MILAIPNPVPMGYPEKLMNALEMRGMSQAQLAQKSGLSPSTISQMLAGNRRPYLDQAAKIARALGVTLDSLVSEDPGPPIESLSRGERALLAVFRELGSDLGRFAEWGIEVSRPKMEWSRPRPQGQLEKPDSDHERPNK
jgi:transcriptional regulator with XRE-family HTH domain